jgi:hypothetical protein
MERGTLEKPIFVSEHPARRYVVRAAAAGCALLFLAWLVALATGISGLGSLPVLPGDAGGSSSGSQSSPAPAPSHSRATAPSPAPVVDRKQKAATRRTAASKDAGSDSTSSGGAQTQRISEPGTQAQTPREQPTAGGGSGSAPPGGSGGSSEPTTGTSQGRPTTTPGGQVPAESAGGVSRDTYGAMRSGDRMSAPE